MNTIRLPRLCTMLLIAITTLFSSHVYAGMLYTITNPAGPNGVAAFEQNPRTGLLQLKAIYPTGGTGNPNFSGCSQDTLVTDGKFLYAVNPGSNDISVFRIDEDGGLRLVGAPVPSGGIVPITLAVRHDLLYVANQGDGVSIPANYTGFSIDHGQLTAIPNSTVPLIVNALPADLQFSADGETLIGTRVTDNAIETFHVTEKGILERRDVLNSPHPFGLQFSPVTPGRLIIALEALPGSASYQLSKDGQMTALRQGVDVPAVDSCWVQIRRDGEFVWLSGFFGQSVVLHRLDRNGVLQPLSLHDTSPFGQFTSDIILDPKQKFLYAVLPGTGQLHVMGVTGGTENGGLTDINTITVPGNAFPMGLVIMNAE